MKKNNSSKQHTSKGNRPKEEKETFAFYIGVDLGDKNSDLCALNVAGEIEKKFRLRMKAADFEAYFRAIGRSRVALEAGGQSQWVAEVIEKCGHEVYVANPHQLRYITESDDKDDPGGLPGRGASLSNATDPPSRNRFRQRAAFSGMMCNLAAICLSCIPLRQAR